LSPRRETGRGLFESDGDPHFAGAFTSLSAHCRKTRSRRVVVRTSQPARARGPLASLHNNEPTRRGQHDGLPDIAFLGGPDRDRGMGGVIVSAKIIAFVPRLNRRRKPVHFPPASFRSAPPPDDLTMDHADTAPCEYVPSFDLPEHDLKNG
jgi:hypothetical protein